MKYSNRWPVPVELSYAEWLIQEATFEVGVDPRLISQLRQRIKKTDQILPVTSTITDEQQLIKRL